MIDVVTINYNDAITTVNFVLNLLEFDSVDKIIIVDNCSTDNSQELLKEIESNKVIILLAQKNGGYGYGNNLGVRYLKDNGTSEYILIANPDVSVSNDTLKVLEEFLVNHSEYVIAAPYMLDRKGVRSRRSAWKIPSKFKAIMSMDPLYSKIFHPDQYSLNNLINSEYYDVDVVSGSLFLTNKSYMLIYGMYDEELFLYGEELVLAIKFRDIGLKSVLLTSQTFIHNHSVSIDKSYSSFSKKQHLFLQSRIYVLREYYRIGRFLQLLAKLLWAFAVLDGYIITLLKKINLWRTLSSR